MSKKVRRESKEIIRPPQQPVKPASLYSLKQDLILGLLLLVFTLAVYQPVWNGKQLWDDDAHITKTELRSPGGLGRIWTELGATQQYYPLLHSVFWIEHHLWGDSTLGYHVVNILLHFISAVLLVFILHRLKIPGAWLAGAVFALHPVQVESVAWITELKNTLSGVFCLSAALVYLKYEQERETRAYALALGLFMLGLMSKSVIATLPVSLLAVIWWKRGRIDWKQDGVPLLPFFIVGIASGLFTAWVEHKVIGAGGSEFDFTIIERCLIAGRAVWFYLSKIAWPVDLVFIYPRWTVSQSVWWQYVFPMAGLILAGVLWWQRNRWRAPLAALICFTATLFPALGFFNVFPFRYSFVADHFQYLACIGPIVLTAAVVSGLNVLKGNRQVMLSMAALLVLGVLTWRQSGMYADAETLYRTIIRENPACWMAHTNLGLLLSDSDRKDEAMAHYQKALAINPNTVEAHTNLGTILEARGQVDEAIAHYQKALEIKPDSAEAHNNFGIALAHRGQVDEAIAHFRRALEIKPDYAEAHRNLGQILAGRRQIDEAIAHYRKALEIKPDYAEAHNNFGIALAHSGQVDEAIAHFRKALEIKPDYAEAHNNFGIALAHSGQVDEAIAHYRKALEIKPDYAEAHNNVGIALAHSGQVDEAIAHFLRALAIKPDFVDARRNLETARSKW